MKSVLEPSGSRVCYECGAYGAEEHHIFYGTSNRRKSEKYGLKVHLCSRHHRDSREGVHGENRELDLCLKRIGQQAFERTHTRKEFMDEFGRNYLP